MQWFEFAAAFFVFLAAHRVPTVPIVRQRLVQSIGEQAFVLGYSTLSLFLLAWLIVAAGRAPYIELWGSSEWQVWIPNIAMPMSCLLAALSIGVPNPLSFSGGDPHAFDPERPGIVGVARHGLLWSLALWSVSHIPPNGDLAHVLLFGVFATFSMYGMRVIDRRKQRQMTRERWAELARRTSFWPFGAMLLGRWRPNLRSLCSSDILRVMLGLAAYLALALSHGWFIGVDPWPR